MARTEIPVYTVNRVAYNPALKIAGDPSNGMYFAGNSGYAWLEIENPGTLAVTVGAAVNGNAVDDIEIPDKELLIPAGSAHKFGPFPKPYYSQDDLSVYIDIETDEYPAEPNAGTNLLFRAFKVA